MSCPFSNMLYNHLTSSFSNTTWPLSGYRLTHKINFQTPFGRLCQAMAFKSVHFTILVLAATALAGCVPEKKYNSLLEAEQACKEWAIKASQNGTPTYHQNAMANEREHINRMKNPRHCNAETLTRQVIGLEYKGKIEADPLLSDKALMHFRY